MKKLGLKDLSLQGKRVLMRVDFNVPLTKEKKVSDPSRILAALPSIRYIQEQGASLVLMSHLGRPESAHQEKYSLAPCAEYLSSLIGQEVLLAPDCIGEASLKLARKLKAGDILLLENLRFHPEEEHPKKNPLFAKELASFGDVYIDDAFGAAHRDHSSITTITEYFKNTSAMGFLMEKEVSILADILQHPKKPFYAILGGSKVDSKIGVIRSLIKKADALFIGGGMAFSFLKEMGVAIGNSLNDPAQSQVVAELIQFAKESKVPLHLPIDAIITKKIEQDEPSKTISLDKGIPEGWIGVDLGPKTIKLWEERLVEAKTILWNGPLGVFEIPSFGEGTSKIANALSKIKATTVIGGGDSVAAIRQLHLEKSFTHLSTGGGATLEFIEYGSLPGIDALSNKT